MEDKFVPLKRVQEMLETEQDRREISYEQKLALQHAVEFSKLGIEKTKDLISELEKMERMNPLAACKIAETLPEFPDEVRAIFSKERFTLSKEEISEILDLVRDHSE